MLGPCRETQIKLCLTLAIELKKIFTVEENILNMIEFKKYIYCLRIVIVDSDLNVAPFE